MYEAASQEEENLVLEEYIQGDNLDFLLKDALFTAEETRTSSPRSAGPCGCSTPWGQSTGT